MKERPILMSGPMVRAILDGRKTQTRRIAPIASLDIKQHDNETESWSVIFTKAVNGVRGHYSGGKFTVAQARSIIASRFNPFGVPGDTLWVRETFVPVGRQSDGGGPDFLYRADLDVGQCYACVSKWTPSIHMPRVASRITLEITGVRVERVQDISEADAISEGIAQYDNGTFGLDDPKECMGTSAVTAYMRLWTHINGPDSWDRNDWVWVVEFRRAK